MWIIRTALALVFLIAPVVVVACTPALPSISHFIDSSLIVYGRATAERWDQASSSLYAQVAVQHVRKGAAPGWIEALSPCALPIRVDEVVVVFNFGDRLIV